jgi:hypothetical protein
MLKQALKWRKEMRLDTNEDFTDFDKLYPGANGNDKDGLPSELATNRFIIEQPLRKRASATNFDQ